MHASWHSQFVDAGLSDFLFNGRHAHPSLSDYILQRLGLSDNWCLEWDSPALQLGLHLSAGQMRLLASRVALVLMSRTIRSAIAGHQVRAWQTALGPVTYRYICKQAPLLGGHRFVPLLETPTTSDPQQITQQAHVLGLRLLAACSHTLDAALGCRMRLKLPRPVVQRSHIKIDSSQYPEIWTWINHIWHTRPTRTTLQKPAQTPDLPSIMPDLAAFT